MVTVAGPVDDGRVIAPIADAPTHRGRSVRRTRQLVLAGPRPGATVWGVTWVLMTVLLLAASAVSFARDPGLAAQLTIWVMASWVVWLLVSSRLGMLGPIGGRPPGYARDVALNERTIAAEAVHHRDQAIMHELRATVVGIALASRLLRDDSKPLATPTRGRLLEMRDSEFDRLERLLTAPSPHHLEAVELDGLLEPLVESLRSRDVVVHWEPTGARAFALADDVAEIVHILLENSARHATGTWLALTVTVERDLVQVSVRDCGPGVTRGVRRRLFEHGVRSPSSDGAGIGLHAAQRLARDLGGGLQLEHPRRRGVGSTFTLTLLGVTDSGAG